MQAAALLKHCALQGTAGIEAGGGGRGCHAEQIGGLVVLGKLRLQCGS